jgi:hypothetical protein
LNICRRDCSPRTKCETADCIIFADTKKYKCQRKPITCDDKNACTTDTCDAEKGCKFTYTISKKCPQYCKDNVDCTEFGLKEKASLNCMVPYCHKKTTTCRLRKTTDKNCKPINTECEVTCKPNHKCETARCVRKTPTSNEYNCVREPITCNDGKDCTVDTCDQKKGCVFTFKESKTCTRQCDKDLDCVAWAAEKKLGDICRKAVCSKSGSCISVRGPQTPKCKEIPECKETRDCEPTKYGSVCCEENGVKKCCENQCTTDLDCVPPADKKDKKRKKNVGIL